MWWSPSSVKMVGPSNLASRFSTSRPDDAPCWGCVFCLHRADSRRGEAVGQPKICGNQAALGSWNVDQCPQLKDDGAGADEAAGDGIYSVEISLDPTSVLEYKLLPQGTWALALGQQGTCDGSGNPTGNDTSNLRILRPDVSRPVRFYLDTRTLSDPGAVQPPGNRSLAIR